VRGRLYLFEHCDGGGNEHGGTSKQDCPSVSRRTGWEVGKNWGGDLYSSQKKRMCPQECGRKGSNHGAEVPRRARAPAGWGEGKEIEEIGLGLNKITYITGLPFNSPEFQKSFRVGVSIDAGIHHLVAQERRAAGRMREKQSLMPKAVAVR